MELVVLAIILSLSGVLAWIFAVALIWVVIPLLAAAFILVICVCGLIGDYRHNKKVAAGKADFRLPFPYRLRGWQIGSIPQDVHQTAWKTGMVHDKIRNRLIPIVRPVYDIERLQKEGRI